MNAHKINTMTINFRQKLERKKGQKEEIELSLKKERRSLRINQREYLQWEEVLLVLQIVAEQTQNELTYHISEIVSLALSSVSDNPYTLQLDFIPKRGKTEAEFRFERDGNIIKDPWWGSGLGMVDVAAFTLKASLWNLQVPKTRNVLILDEPFKHLKGEKENKKIIEMVKEISKKLNLQIIMVSDERVDLKEIEKGADKIFSFSKRRNQTIVKIVK